MIERLERLIGKTATMIWVYVVALGLIVWASWQIYHAIHELFK